MFKDAVYDLYVAGGTLPPLHGAAVVDIGQRQIIWGGLDLSEYRCTDDLMILQELTRPRRGAPIFQITYIQTLKHQVPSRLGKDIPHQTGPVPSGMTQEHQTELHLA